MNSAVNSSLSSRSPVLDAEVVVTAVLSRTRMPARVLATLRSGDVLETEPELGHQPLVRLTIGTTTLALASIAKVEGRLIATIIDNPDNRDNRENRPELSGRKDDTWKVRTPKPSTD
jgi:flagellar motor switch/type III secretory pathway protein FliN